MIKIKLITPLFICSTILIWHLWVMTHSQITFYSDDAIYAEIARFWVQKKMSLVFHPTWPPLYPFLAFLFYQFTYHWESALRLISIISGSLIVFPLWFLAKKNLPSNHTLIYLAAVVIITPYLKSSQLPLSDMLSTLLATSSLVLIAYALELQKIQLFMGAAFSLGLMYLTRAEGALFFYLTTPYLLIWSIAKKRKWVVPIFITVFFITIGPYLFITKIQTGKWSLSLKTAAQIQQGHSFEYRGGSTWSQEIVSVKIPNYRSTYFHNGLRFILDNFDLFIFLFRERLVSWSHVFLTIFPIWYLPLILLGILRFLKRKNLWANSYVVFILFAALPPTVLFTVISEIRYLLWSLPLLVFLFCLGINYLFQKITIRYFSLISSFAMVAGLIFLPSINLSNLLKPSDYAQDITRNHYRPEIIKGGVWLQDNSLSDDPKIMMRHEGIEFYAEGITIYTPQQLTLNETIQYANQNGTDYLAAWSDEIAFDNDLKDLLLNDFYHPQLRKVFQTEDSRRILIIYQLTSTPRPAF